VETPDDANDLESLCVALSRALATVMCSVRSVGRCRRAFTAHEVCPWLKANNRD